MAQYRKHLVLNKDMARGAHLDGAVDAFDAAGEFAEAERRALGVPAPDRVAPNAVLAWGDDHGEEAADVVPQRGGHVCVVLRHAAEFSITHFSKSASEKRMVFLLRRK